MVALLAIEFRAHCSLSPFNCLGPRSIEPRWIVADMLIVTTRQLSNPVLMVVQMEAGNRLQHVLFLPPNA